MKNTKNYLCYILLVIFLGACSESDEYDTFIVDSKKVLGTHPLHGEVSSFKVKRSSSAIWEHITYIEDFDYEEGYIYVIEVRIKSPNKSLADDEATYRCMEVISKTKDVTK